MDETPAEAKQRRALTDQVLIESERALRSAPKLQALDSARPVVFQRGADGKLYPKLGWRTTGPFEFGTWSHNIDWQGVVRDLGAIASRSIASSGLVGVLSRRLAAGSVCDGISRMDKATLGAGVYTAGDAALRELEPVKRPKHWCHTWLPWLAYWNSERLAHASS